MNGVRNCHDEDVLVGASLLLAPPGAVLHSDSGSSQYRQTKLVRWSPDSGHLQSYCGDANGLVQPPVQILESTNPMYG